MEKEKMRDYKERERKYHKERTHILSLQTSQRQRVIEGRKRAMAAAEEERRRKALEDRRQSQKLATDRFRSAVGRVRSKPSGSTGQNFVIGVNMPPSSVKPRCSQPYHNQVQVIPLESKFQYRNIGEHERLAIGREVEINPPTRVQTPSFGLHRKTPSLDDILKGSGAKPDTPHLRVQKYASKLAPDIENVKSKSASDSNLNMLAQTEKESLDSCNTPNHGDNSTSVEDYESTILLHDKVPFSDIRSETVVSPENCSVLQENCLSNPRKSPDSLNSSITESVTLNDKLNSTPSAFEDIKIKCPPSADQDRYVSKESIYSHPMFTCGEESDISMTDSLEDPEDSVDESLQSKFNTLAISEISTSDRKPKLVGILKKTDQSSPRIIKAGFQKSLRFGNDTQISKSRKRVHFSDQVESDQDNNITDSAQIELWKKLFPPRPLPNSAFTPRMKCSLSTTQGVSRVMKRPIAPGTNGVTVHIPDTATIEESQSSKDSDTDNPSSTKINSNLEISDVTYDMDGTDVTKSPTDAEINQMWDQIRQCLREGRKVSVPPRLFNFKAPTGIRGRNSTSSNRITDPLGNVSTDSSTSTLANTRLLSAKASNLTQSNVVRKNGMNHMSQKQLMHRQQHQNRISRYHSEPQRTQPVPKSMQHSSGVREASTKDSLHPTIQPSSKEPLRASTNAANRAPLSALSLEEQKLMQSIERINKRLKDHFVRPTPPHTSEYNYPVPPSTPPKRQNNGRTRGNTPKYGIHHTPPRLVATNYRSVNSRTPSKLADQ